MVNLDIGLGLRSRHFDFILEHRPPVSWFEIISENFMMKGGRALWALEKIRENYPLAMHGVSMSLGSTDPLNGDYLNRLKALAGRLDPLWVSDHLCWTGVSGLNGHDLWPLPHTEESIHHVAARIQKVQDFLGRRIAIENVSSYLAYVHSTMSEWEFLKEVAERADCRILLDLNNVFVNAHNHGFDPYEYIDHVPWERVIEIHLAGPSVEGRFLLDTHDHPVMPEVWDLYRTFIERAGPRPTLLEWDDKIPDFPVLWEEARKAEKIRNEILLKRKIAL